LREFKGSQHASRLKLAEQLGKHLEKHQVRSTSGLCHISNYPFSVKFARPSKGACALAHGRSPLGAAGRPPGPESFTTHLRCCKVRNTHLDINAHCSHLHEPFF
jgi:hypothetical protein